MKTTNHGLGRTTIKQSVLDRLWAEAVRRQVLGETIELQTRYVR